MSLPIIYLKKHEEKRILAGHLWLFSNELDPIKSPLKTLASGELVQVHSAQGRALGIFTLNPKTLLCGRLLSKNPDELIDKDFFARRLQKALDKRKLFMNSFYNLGAKVPPLPENQSYRLVHSEGDFLPGLILDRFGDFFVGQITTAGMEKLRPQLEQAIIEVFKPKGLLWKNDHSYRDVEGIPKEIIDVLGNFPDEITVLENDCQYQIHPKTGQKTGWFYDLRRARAILASVAPGKKVLDLFSYAGGFSIPCAKNGAEKVVSLDASRYACERVRAHAELNGVASKVHALEEDVFQALTRMKEQGERFDIIVCDPPAFIKKRKDIPVGKKAYTRLNRLALSLLSENGIFFSASCSMLLSEADLKEIVGQAAANCGFNLSIQHIVHQDFDHPMHPAIPETGYLKGFVLT